jgi:hypothetical protein
MIEVFFPIFFCIALGLEGDAYLSSASVLLPFDFNVKFEVSAFNGCFKWYVLSGLLPNLWLGELVGRICSI